MHCQKAAVTFLLLPPELRLYVYKYALTGDQQTLIAANASEPAFDGLTNILSKERMTPSLLRTCRLIYKEAIHVFYSSNTFIFNSPSMHLRWASSVGPTNLQMLRSIRLHFWPILRFPGVSGGFTKDPVSEAAWHKLLDLLVREATGLRHLSIYYEDDSVGARSCGKEISYVQEIAKFRKLESVKVDGYYAKNWPAYLAKEMHVSRKSMTLTKNPSRNSRKARRTCGHKVTPVVA